MKKMMYTTLVMITALSMLAGCGTSRNASSESITIIETASETTPAGTEESAEISLESTADESAESTEPETVSTESAATVLSPGDNLNITQAGEYVLTGTYENQMIVVDAGEEDEITLILENAVLSNNDGPAIFVRSAGNVTIIASEGTENSISDGSDYTLTEDDSTLDAAVFSKDDLTISGEGNLTINGNYKHAVVSKDDLTITAANLTINAVNDGLSGKDSLTFSDGSAVITAGSDGLYSDEKVEVSGGTLSITAEEGIEATCVLISGGDITMEASDDGINASWKSESLTPAIEISGGTITITMGAGDTDGIDSNGDLIISGGTISVNGNSAFDYDGNASFTGGTLYVNGQQVDTLSNQMMGGDMGGFGGPGSGFGGPGNNMGDKQP